MKLHWFNRSNDAVVWVLICRLCWSPRCTWLSLCTAAAASLLPSPPALCPSRLRAEVCKSPAIGSGDRRWSATVQEGSLTPALAPRARTNTLAHMQPKREKARQEETGRVKKAKADFWSSSVFLLFRHHSGRREPGGTVFSQHVSVLIICQHHCCHVFATV